MFKSFRMLTQSEENYIKAIYQLSESDNGHITTNLLADKMNTKASSVTDMLKKLADKSLVVYTKYQGCSLTQIGQKTALIIIRKHRLWETFLVEKLNFGWEEVHVIAEQLEHIQSTELTDKLDAFLGYPKVDPHGDPIPSADGTIQRASNLMLFDCEVGQRAIVTGVKDGEVAFLKYLNKIGCQLGTHIHVLEKFSFDESMLVEVNEKQIQFSAVTAKRITIIPE